MGDKIKDLSVGILLMVLFVLCGLFGASVPFVASFVGVFAVFYSAYLLGWRLFPGTNVILASVAALIPFFALQSIAQTIWFYASGRLGIASDIWCGAAAMLVSLGIFFVAPDRPSDGTDMQKLDVQRVGLGLVCLALSLASSLFTIIIAGRRAVSDAILTPWAILPSGILPAIAIAWLAVFLGIRLVRSRELAMLQAALAIAATTSVAPLLYRLGFGFDGFLHVATEKIILASGTLTPKPFYYIGQYVFTTWIARMSALPIDHVDRWLIPAGAALLLPLAAYLGMKKDDPPWGIFLLFLAPLAPFIATTPQSFAYLLGFAALLLCRGVHENGRVHPLAPLLLALWAVAVHPLAGLPIVLIVAALCIAGFEPKGMKKMASIVSWVLVVGSAIAVPLAFYVLSLHGSTPITWNIASIFTASPWQSLLASLTPWLGNRFVVWPAWTTLAIRALPVLLFVSGIASIVWSRDEERKRTALLVGAAIGLTVAAAILKSAGDFAFLIDYERGNYADRLNLLALFCLVPASFPALELLCERMRRVTPFVGATFLAGCLAVAAAQAYDALPRNDALITGHGWSVGQSDIAAVKAIDRDAAGSAYTVLADQSVSAAAVSQLGFKRYNDDVFFYPIPTGGKLYDEYLRMTYSEPSLDTIKDAARLGGTNLVYVVLNDYWWNADNLVESLGAISNDNWTFGDTTMGPGHVDHVYKFDVSKPISAPTARSGS